MKLHPAKEKERDLPQPESLRPLLANEKVCDESLRLLPANDKECDEPQPSTESLRLLPANEECDEPQQSTKSEITSSK